MFSHLKPRGFPFLEEEIKHTSCAVTRYVYYICRMSWIKTRQQKFKHQTDIQHRENNHRKRQLKRGFPF